MTKYQGLGKGLGSLIAGSDQKVSAQLDNNDRIQQIEVYKIKPNINQPRHYFDHASLEELIDSIKEHGIIQPLVATKEKDGYQLIAGERRLRSAKLLEMETVPVVIRKASEQDRLELALVENIQRKDLNPLEKARGYQKLIDQFSLTQDQVAKKVGKSRVAVTNSLRLLQLPGQIQKAISEEKISEGQAKVILSLDQEGDQNKLFKKILSEKLTVRQSERQVRRSRPGQKNKLTGLSPELEEKIDQLRQALGTKVAIKGNKKRGQIIIDYYSDQELHELINKIT